MPLKPALKEDTYKFEGNLPPGHNTTLNSKTLKKKSENNNKKQSKAQDRGTKPS